MTITQEEIDTLVDFCNSNLGDPQLWKTPAGYPDSLALCIIDSIFSTGSHYSSVTNVVNRYRSAHGSTHGAQDLLDSIRTAGGPAQWAEDVIRNVKPAHTRPNAPLKASVIEKAASMLVDLGIDTVSDFKAQVAESPQSNPVHAAWKKLPSQSSGVTYNYMLILTGLPSVKPDRMVLRFLGTALGEQSPLTQQRAVELITATADSLGVSPRTLDHIAWRAASGRSLSD